MKYGLATLGHQGGDRSYPGSQADGHGLPDIRGGSPGAERPLARGDGIRFLRGVPASQSDGRHGDLDGAFLTGIELHACEAAERADFLRL